MDITGLDIGALVAGVGAVLKSFHSDRNSNESKKAMEARCDALEKRLNDGDHRFEIIDSKIDKTLDKVDKAFDKIGDVDKGVSSMVSFFKGKGFDI